MQLLITVARNNHPEGTPTEPHRLSPSTMVSIGNLTSVLGKKKDPNAEDTLLAAWTGRDSDTTEPAICVRWAPDGSFLAAG